MRWEIGNSGNRSDYRWQLLLRRAMFVWEKELKQQLLALLSTAQWKRNVLDGWIWDEDDLHSYSVRSGYKILQDFTLFIDFAWFRELWSLKVASSTQVCVCGGQCKRSYQLEAIW